MFHWVSSWCHGLFLYLCDSKSSSFLFFPPLFVMKCKLPFCLFSWLKTRFYKPFLKLVAHIKMKDIPFHLCLPKQKKQRKVSKSKITFTEHIPFLVPQAIQNYFHRFKWENLAKKCCISSHSLWGSTTEMWKFLEKYKKLVYFEFSLWIRK